MLTYKEKLTRRGFLKAFGVSAATLLCNVGGDIYAQQEIKEFNVKLRRYVYTPSTFTVRKGDRVRFNLQSTDVTHGFYVDGYDLQAVVRPFEKTELEFIADKAGAFQIRCSVTCGPGHPIMRGKLTVEPNNRFLSSIILAAAAPIATLLYLATRGYHDEQTQ